MIDRLELVQAQVAELDQERDAVLEDTAPDKAAKMIQQLATLRGVGVQSATVLVREAFVREFPNGKALGSYAGLTATPYSSGGAEREQGISKAGNRRLRTVMVELAWLWHRYQPGSVQVSWFRERANAAGRRARKVMIVALARKLLIALWRLRKGGDSGGRSAEACRVVTAPTPGAAAPGTRSKGASPLSGLVLSPSQ